MWGGKQLVSLGGFGASVPATTSGADIFYIAIPFRCRPIRVGFTVTTAPTDQAAIINFDSITYLATGNQTRGDCDVGQIIIPVNTYRNKCVYDETDASDAVTTDTWKGILEEGQVVAVQVYQTSTAGAGWPFIVVEVDNERPANNANMIQSA
jgi:hypothetical protein